MVSRMSWPEFSPNRDTAFANALPGQRLQTEDMTYTLSVSHWQRRMCSIVLHRVSEKAVSLRQLKMKEPGLHEYLPMECTRRALGPDRKHGTGCRYPHTSLSSSRRVDPA
jgi:hypothetical protein